MIKGMNASAPIRDSHLASHLRPADSLSSMSDPQSNDIAIVGMAAHLPGAKNVSEFWSNLRSGVESVREFTDEELEAAGVSRAKLSDPDYVKAGILLEDLECFDGPFFGFTPKDAGIMDPQHRHFLECCWEALEDAGHTAEGFDGSIGVYAGCGMGAYFLFNICTNPELVDQVGLFLLRHTGNDKDFLATRVSYEMNLKGPSVNVQTACSTSAVAIHMAAQSLLNGECDMALAGGVTILLPHGQGYRYEKNEVLSPDGHCRAFDVDAKGTVFGSGAGTIVLRRLEDAIADGDDIRAVIKGSAINNDGTGKVGYLAPSVDRQGDAIAEAVAISGLEARSISYVEAHGTGTAVGDPIEIAALTQAFRESTTESGFCRIGSVKTNIGHLDTAAGVASVIKVVEAMRHRELPPTLHYRAPNPAIDFAATPFIVNSELTEWTSNGEPRRAGVSSLGVGGTNAHIVLEEAPEQEASGEPRRSWQLFCVSGRNKAALQRNTESLASWFTQNDDANLADVAWTLRKGRVAFERRRVVVAESAAEASRLLSELDPKRVFDGTTASTPRDVAFLMPGGGTQYARMAADLYETESVYRESFDECITLAGEALGAELKRLILENPEGASELLERTTLQLPALFITSYSLAKLWASLGIEPAAFLGHSLGENTAACLAGVFSLKDAIGLVSLRGRLIEEVEPGAMLSVSLNERDATKLLTDELCLAAVNGPKLCAISGPNAAIEELERRLEREEIDYTRIRVATAGHSHLLDPILPEFRAYLDSIELSPPKVKLLSNRTGTWMTDAQATDPEYWVGHLRGTIRFADCVHSLAKEGNNVLLEVGPGTVLGSLARMTANKEFGKTSFHSLRHRNDMIHDQAFLLSTLGRLWAAGVAVDWNRLDGDERRRRVALPTYSFEKQRYWIEPGAGIGADAKGDSSALRKLEALEDWFHVPVWEASIRPEGSAGDTDWLVFADDSRASCAFLQEVARRGQRAAVVRPGKEFAAQSDLEFRICPSEKADYVAVLESLAAADFVPQRVAHLWLTTDSELTDATTNFFHQVQERGFYSLLFLGQALGDSLFEAPLTINVVTNHMQALEAEDLAHPVKAAVLGPCRVLPREMSNVRCKSVDVRLPEWKFFSGTKKVDAQFGHTLFEELNSDDADASVCLRGIDRFVEKTEPRLVPKSKVDAILPGAVVLVTGGLGGLGLAMAERFASTPDIKLILLGRSELPAPRHWDGWLASHSASHSVSQKIVAVRKLEQLGAEVMVVAADVANHEQMEATVQSAEERFGKITGVLHAAGVIEDAVVGMKDPASVDRVFSPKIHGALVLEQVLAHCELDFFLLFSSTSSLLGLVGQVDYTAANAFLNAFANSRNRSGSGSTIAIDWGIWKDVGMAAGSLRRPELAATTLTRVVGEETNHPLLGRRVVQSESETIFLAKYDPRTHWVLSDHRLATGEALIPGTGFLEIGRAAFVAAGKGHACELAGFTFLTPLQVCDGAPREVRVRVEHSVDSHRVEISSRASAKDEWSLHAQGDVKELQSNGDANFDVQEANERCSEGAVALTADGRIESQLQHLNFGRRWQALTRISLGEREAVADLRLADEFAADLATFELHPGLFDLCTGFAHSLIPGFEPAGEFYAPMSYGTVRIHAPLEEEVTSYARLRDSQASDVARFDVRIMNQKGATLIEVEDFCLRRVADTSVLGSASASRGKSDGPSRGALEDGPLQTLLREGISPSEGVEALMRILSQKDAAQIVVSSIDLEELRNYVDSSQMHFEGSQETAFERPELDSDFVKPRDDVERELVAFWSELLGVDRVGIEDDFFELGGYSLIAVRLFARVRKRFGLEFPLSILFEAPTVAKLAALLRAELGLEFGDEHGGAPVVERPNWTHLVPMQVRQAGSKQSSRPPFFLCAGMFGNVMNLRHLAGHIGNDQPFYGLQAMGVDGRSAPHTTFEEQAAAYLEEVREVQPQGPYFLGGFSGGGIVAYEMARQLREAGEVVGALVMLDTWVPFEQLLTREDRREMHKQRFQARGIRYAWEILYNRFQRNRKRLSQIVNARAGKLRPYEFAESNIELAFRSALVAYDTPEYSGDIALMRPKLDVAHELSSGNRVSSDANYVYQDNDWSRHCTGEISVFEVPGDHDNMVLEPNVRILAAQLREFLDQAEANSTRATQRHPGVDDSASEAA